MRIAQRGARATLYTETTQGEAVGSGWLPALLVAVVTGYAVLTRPPGPRLADLDVYLGAVTGLRHGDSLYDFILGNAPFTYPPFAGLLLVPLTGVPKMGLQVFWTLTTVIAVVLIGHLAGARRAPLITLALFLSAPVSSDLRYGQVSVFLGLLVLVDVLRPMGRANGVLIGLAAAIKLTPLIFIPMLWLGGRRRAAVTATATFVACATAAALVLPADSWRYWTTEVRDVNRLGFIDSVGNQSLNGALLRMGLDSPVRQGLVLLLGGLVVLFALHRARKMADAGDWLAATVVVGAAGVVLSPVSWTHHQIWLVLGAFLARNAVARAAGLALMLLPSTAVWGEARLLWAVAVATMIQGRDANAPPPRPLAYQSLLTRPGSPPRGRPRSAARRCGARTRRWNGR
jgi:alpha-1,2-mannosyltransferase